MFKNDNRSFTNKTVNITKYESSRTNRTNRPNRTNINGNIILNGSIHTINISEFVDILNSIPSSKNAIDICNSLGIYDVYCKNYAVQYSITYYDIFKGKNKNNNALQILNTIGFDKKIIFNNNIIRNIIYIKTKLYEFKEKQQFDNVSAEWIGILAGIYLYFDNIDEQNYNHTHFLKDIYKPLTINNF